MVEVTQDSIRRKASVLRAALAAKEAELAAERAKVEKLRAVIDSSAWTIANQQVAKALCQAVAHCSLGPSDDEGFLSLYDIIPEEWCSPSRFDAANDIAENIAFSALDAWLKATRATLAETQP